MKSKVHYESAEEEIQIGLPERCLLNAMLARAFCDITATSSVPHIRSAAYSWVFKNSKKPKEFSFLWVTECLDIDPQVFRKAVRLTKNRRKNGDRKEIRFRW